MRNADAPSVIVRLTSFTFFISFSVTCFWWFIVSSYGTFHSLLVESLIISFSKGAMYALGAGIASLTIVYIGAFQIFKKTELSKKQEKLTAKLLFLFIVLMFCIPAITHFAVNKIAITKGYFECEQMSYRWLLYSKYYYTESESVCNALVKEKQRK